MKINITTKFKILQLPSFAVPMHLVAAIPQMREKLACNGMQM